MTRLSMRFDLRVPPFAKTTHADQHRAMLEMVTWADRVGIDTVILSEHHGDPAGYSPAPLTLAASVLARSERVKVTISAALVPLHDPVRLAEQLATIDCLAPGRLSMVLGAGYRQPEFHMAGIERSRRGPLVEECISVLRSAWTGEPFQWRGRDMLVTPKPATPGGPAISVGGKTQAGARRAARLRTPFSPAVASFDVVGAYYEECERVGFDGADVYGLPTFEAYRNAIDPNGPVAPGFIMLSRDPNATWEQVAPHAEYDASTYAAWQEDGVVSDWAVPGADRWEELRDSGRYAILTPDECIALARRDGQLMLHPLMGGISPDVAWGSLELFEEAVLPALRP